MSMSLHQPLACIRCHGELAIQGDALRCPACDRDYPVRDGIAYLMPRSVPCDSRYSLEIRRYNAIAERGPERYAGLEKTKPTERARLVAGLIRETGVGSFVNLGPGFGALEREAADLHRVAVDQCDAFLRRLRQADPTIQCVNAIAERLPFPDRSVEFLLSESTFQTITSRERFLYEMGRVVADDGHFLITIAYSWNYPRRPQDGFNVLKPDELETLRCFLDELGFKCAYTYLHLESMTWKQTLPEADYLFIAGRRME